MKAPLQVDVITLFPGMLDGFLGESMLKKASEAGLARFRTVQLRDFTTDRHRTVDDAPYGGGYGMPSAHAANTFGQAFFFSVHYERVSWYLILFAALISLSRVFVGVHYPGDVIIGALLGGVIGIIMALIFRRFEGRIAGNVAEGGSEEG